MHQVHAETLGTLLIRRSGRELPQLLGQPVRLALLLYLSLEREATRDEPCQVLWHDRDDRRARHALRQTLYELRRTLGTEWLDEADERLRVAPGVASDARRFLDALDAEDDRVALALYRGPFLLVESGHRAEAISHFELYRERLSAELSIQPLENIQSLVDSPAPKVPLEATSPPLSIPVTPRRWREGMPHET